MAREPAILFSTSSSFPTSLLLSLALFLSLFFFFCLLSTEFHIDQAGFKLAMDLSMILTSSLHSQILGLQACTTNAWQHVSLFHLPALLVLAWILSS